MDAIVLFCLILLGLLIFVAALGIRIVRPYQKGVVERIGKFNRICGPGLNFIFPVLEGMVKVDMRETVVDVPPQQVITKDNVVVTVDAVVYLEIADPFNFRYNVDNFWMAVTKLAQTNLRNVIGDMTLDESLVSRDTINHRLREVLDTATDKWGAKVTRVEIQRIDPPKDVAEAMHRQMKAERDRRAMILEAEGQRESAILVAEGNKQARIREAEGEAEAIVAVADADRYEKLTVAEGEAQAIEKVYSAIHEGNPTADLIAIKYLESLGEIANGQATKIFMPFEASGILGAIGGIGGLFEKDNLNGHTGTVTPTSQGATNGHTPTPKLLRELKEAQARLASNGQSEKRQVKTVGQQLPPR